MTYCRILLPHLLDVPRLIYLDCDVLVFRDLAQLFDLELAPGKVLAAPRDSETLSLADDSPTIADAINLPREGAYFNCGVMLMNLDALRRQNFLQRSVEFLNNWSGKYRFWDQSAINFLLHGQIDELPEYWNRASWRFDAQQNNDLDCVLHYTTSAPWLGGTRGPAQVLFERLAVDAGLPVNRQAADFKKKRRQELFRNALAPFRALAFPLVSLFYKNPPAAEAGRLLWDRVIRRSYVSLSTEPWHGTWRLLSQPAAEDLEGVDVVHLHTVADWFDVPRWLEALPRRMGVVISVHDMWHVTGGCFLYRGCDRYAKHIQPCDPCPILRWPANRFLAKAAHSRKLLAYRNCGARMVANSHWLAEIAGRSPIAKACGGVKVIPPGIDA